MGFWGSIGDRVRGLLRFDKETVVLNLAKGATNSSYASSGFDLMAAYGENGLTDHLKLDHDLMSRYMDMEEMDEYPELSSAIDIYADDSTQTESLMNKVVWVDSSDRTVQTILEDLLWKRLRIDEEIWEMTRTVVKYGNSFEELQVAGDGVVGMLFLPPPSMRRIEGRRGELFGFVQSTSGRFNYSPEEFKQLLASRGAASSSGPQNKYAALEDWEVVHFRLRGKQRRSMYGHSVLDSARWIWKRLMLLEDSAMVYRLQRAPQRFAFYIDVGDMPPKEAMGFLQKMRQQYKKTKFYNPQTGKLDLKYNPLSSDEDFFVPVRKGVQATKIDVISAPNWQSMDDINYFKEKMYSAIKVPKTYLGSDTTMAKGSLSQQDVRFARTVLRIQREMRNGIKKICRVHLAALGINPAQVDFEIYMTVPSSIFELAQLEVRNAKADFAGRMSQFVSLHWILQKVFALSEEEIEYIIKERHDEQLADAEVQAKAMGLTMDVQNQGALQQQAASTHLQQQQMPPEPNTQKAEDMRKHLRQTNSMSHMWPQMRQQLGYRPISHKELFEGSRENEKLVSDNLNKILESNTGFAKKISELGHLINELKSCMPRR